MSDSSQNQNHDYIYQSGQPGYRGRSAARQRRIRQEDEDILRLKALGLKPLGDNFVYVLNSKLLFGKYRRNELRHVYKIDPEYIEWCMLYAEGFIIDPVSLKILQDEPVFNLNDINQFYNSDDIYYDLRTFKSNPPHNFRGNPNVREEHFEFSELALTCNQTKLEEGVDDLAIYFKGGKWEELPTDIKVPSRRSKIIIKV